MPQPPLLDLLRRSGGLAAIANNLGIDQPATLAAAEVLLPRIQQALHDRVGQAGGSALGMGQLLAQLADLGGGKLAGALLQQSLPGQGEIDRIAGAILGEEDNPEQGLAKAAQRSGLPVETVRRVRPLLAMLTGGYLSARASQLSAADCQAELWPLLDPAQVTNRLDAAPGILDQPGL